MEEKHFDLRQYLPDDVPLDAVTSMYVDPDGNVHINYDVSKFGLMKVPFPPGTTHFLHFHLKRTMKRHVRQLKR